MMNNLESVRRFEIELPCTLIEGKSKLGDDDIDELIFDLKEQGFYVSQVYEKIFR